MTTNGQTAFVIGEKLYTNGNRMEEYGKYSLMMELPNSSQQQNYRKPQQTIHNRATNTELRLTDLCHQANPRSQPASRKEKLLLQENTHDAKYCVVRICTHDVMFSDVTVASNQANAMLLLKSLNS